ncbi:acyl-CoA thioesterase [Halobellus marinus]|jgi:4-hydroxybenzoyl-CoA thioesterase|uniref:acyl-CoA thioesterase n=1 Tax=Halobellus TaxID=1073986 RepID=UPI0028A731EF|nr:acyl-CoA thioesterase [Halobellus sp. DFY28]
MFERTWTVRFSDTDPHGIAHYPRIVDALHETSDMFMQEIGFPFWELTGNYDFGFPLVDMRFEFEHPLHAGDDVRITLTPDPSTRAVRFEYDGFVGDDTLAFSGYEQRVCAGTSGGGAQEIPEEIRSQFVEYADGE